MDYFSVKADKDRDQRMETKNYLFMAIYATNEPEKHLGMAIGKQLDELRSVDEINNIVNNKDTNEIYKIFRAYIKSKTMKVQTLKDPMEFNKHVDKICREKNNLISISVVENKVPAMDMYYSTKCIEFKEDFISFYKNYKS